MTTIDGYWRSMHWVMVNHQTKKSTVLDFKDFTFDVGLDENDFVKERLKRIN
jgi:outer membrane lipoprotein-sorting protein